MLVPGGSVTFAVAVDDPTVPDSGPLAKELRVAMPSVMTPTLITVPNGTFVPCNTTATGFAVAGFTVRSGGLK
jgi:hypothetical protein